MPTCGGRARRAGPRAGGAGAEHPLRERLRGQRCSRSTAAGARPMRSPPTRTPATSSSTSSGSTRRHRWCSWSARSSSRIRRSPPPRASCRRRRRRAASAILLVVSQSSRDLDALHRARRDRDASRRRPRVRARARGEAVPGQAIPTERLREVTRALAERRDLLADRACGRGWRRSPRRSRAPTFSNWPTTRTPTCCWWTATQTLLEGPLRRHRRAPP